MSDRKTVNTVTDDDLTTLYDEIDALTRHLLPDHIIDLPAPADWLTSNDRREKYGNAVLVKAWRHAGKQVAKQLPKMLRVRVVVYVQFRDRRRRDPANWYPTAKALVDGIVDAGVLPDDSSKFVIGPDMRLGDVLPKVVYGPVGAVQVHIFDLSRKAALMRIRSTKPEFWRSARIASVSWEARFVFKGLESYVDDNGVGKDDVALIVGDVFPRDMLASPRETVARVSEAISQLHRAGLIHRYKAAGTPLLCVAFWEQSQRIDKPGKGRLPRPDGTMNYKESEIRESVASPPETLAPGTGEQGNRGTGDKPPASPPEPTAEEIVQGELFDDDTPEASGVVVVAEPVNAGHIVKALIDACRATNIELPKKIIGQYAKTIKGLLDEKYTAQQIWEALTLMHDDKILNRPSLLPNKVVTVQSGPERAPAREARSTTDDRVTGWLNLDLGTGVA
jgi:hypothetical protein